MSKEFRTQRTDTDAMSAKVFGIGLSKTGTTSLFAALAELGYRSATYRHSRSLGLDDWFAGDFSTDYYSDFDAVTDLPVATFFAELDRRYPGSKFILTVRDLDAWSNSAHHHFSRAPASSFGRDVRLATYGIHGFDERRFRRVYESHEREVLDHFRGRDRDLLFLDVTAGEGWDVLCPFLGWDVPSTPFPHVQPGHRLADEDDRPA